MDGGNTLLAGYGSGAVIAWDMGTQLKLFQLSHFSLQLGPDLTCLWKKLDDQSGNAQRDKEPEMESSMWSRGGLSSGPTRAALLQVSRQSAEAIDSALQSANATVEDNRAKVLLNRQTQSSDGQTDAILIIDPSAEEIRATGKRHRNDKKSPTKGKLIRINW